MLRLLLLTAVVLCGLAGSHLVEGQPGSETAAATSRSALSSPLALSVDQPARPAVPSHLPTVPSVGGGSEPHTEYACLALATLLARQAVLGALPTPAGGVPDNSIGSSPPTGAAPATPVPYSVGLRLADLAVRQT